MRPRGGGGAAGRVRGACAVAAALAAAAAAAVALCWADVFDAILSRAMRLSPEGEVTSEWTEPTLPLFFDVYLFNWTNPERLNGGERPHLVQLGPYRYRETRRKEELVWHAHNHSVSYRTRRRWSFQPRASNGSLNDVVTTLNVVAASAVYKARHWSFWWQMLLSGTMSGRLTRQQLWERRSAAELLFDGYENPLLDMARFVNLSGDGPPVVDRFGWFYKRNGSLDNDGHMTVSTGGGGGGLPGQILLWNHAERMAHLAAECAQLRGSLGEFFPRRLSERGVEAVTLFSPDLCRPLPFTPMGAGAVHGVPVLRFAAHDRMLDNGTLHPENECYCGGECVPSGALNVSACRLGAPAFVSLPHFLHADPQYIGAVTGLAPDPDRHSFYLDIEPTSGVPLDVAARFQLNILLLNNPNVQLFADVPQLMFPVLWVEQRVLVPAEVARRVGAARAGAAWGGVGLAAAAAAALTACLLLMAPRLLRRAPPSAPAPPELATLMPPPPPASVACDLLSAKTNNQPVVSSLVK